MKSSPDMHHASPTAELKSTASFFVEALASRPLNTPDDWALRLTHWFAREKSSDGMRVLALMGELSSGIDEYGMDAMCWAARGGDEDCLLLAGEACGASQKDCWGSSALHHWAETKMGAGGAGAQILMAFGALPAARDRWGFLPMHWSRDASVWAWSMAALWSIGEPDGWARCGVGGWEAAVDVLENADLARWLNLSPWGRVSLASRPYNLGGKVATELCAVARVEIRGREQMIEQMIGKQNCIAKQLGIQLLPSAELA